VEHRTQWFYLGLSVTNDSRVDAVVPVYGEREEALRRTLQALALQDQPFEGVVVVDDGSPQPVALPRLDRELHVKLLRVEENAGISAARNAGIAQTSAPLVACINVEVLPAPDWVAACRACLDRSPRVGACFTRMVPEHPQRLLSRWRMRFHEQPYPGEDGDADFAPGHAVLLRRAALLEVGPYDVRLRRIGEDFELSRRLLAAGWGVRCVAASYAVSIQRDTLGELAYKQLIRSGWEPRAPSRRWRLLARAARELLHRLGRNVYRFHWDFLPVDLAIFAIGVWILLTTRLKRRG
jgi:GT2 family glycosyltransferase